METIKDNCPNCGAPCTVSGIGYDYREPQNPELLKENEQLKEKLKAQEEHGQIIWKDREDIRLLNAELLGALKAILPTFTEYSELNSEFAEENNPRIITAKLAISKAENGKG